MAERRQSLELVFLLNFWFFHFKSLKHIIFYQFFFFTFCYYCFILLHVIYLEVLHVKFVDVNFVLNMSHFSFKYFILEGLKLRISHFKYVSSIYLFCENEEKLIDHCLIT